MVSPQASTGGGGFKSFADASGITADMKHFEREANDSGLGLAVGAAKLIGGAMAKEAAKEKAAEAQRAAERQFQQAQEDLEKDAVLASIKSIDFGKDSVSIISGITALLDIIASYRYELSFPMGPKGPCMGAVEEYKKDLWKQAEKKAEKGIELLRKKGTPKEADDFAAKLQVERDNVDPKIVKERLIAEKEAEKQAKIDEKAEKAAENEAAQEAKAEERAEKAAERAEKTAEFKEKAGATFEEIKKDGIGGFFTKRVDGLMGSATDKTEGLADKLKGGFGGLGGLFGKKK
jgi:hypothetical protein